MSETAFLPVLDISRHEAVPTLAMLSMKTGRKMPGTSRQIGPHRAGRRPVRNRPGHARRVLRSAPTATTAPIRGTRNRRDSSHVLTRLVML